MPLAYVAELTANVVLKSELPDAAPMLIGGYRLMHVAEAVQAVQVGDATKSLQQDVLAVAPSCPVSNPAVHDVHLVLPADVEYWSFLHNEHAKNPPSGVKDPAEH